MRFTPAKKKKFLKNLLRFTAPGLAVVFSQLALGADWKVALLAGLYVIYSLASDFFSKIK